MLIKKMLNAAALLTFFAVLGGGLVAFSFQITHKQIIANERAALLRTLNVLIPRDQYDNDLFTDIRQIQNEAVLGTVEPITIYRARKNGQPVAAILTQVAPDAYNGRIRLLVGINYEGSLVGVRVLSHQETPGLGDKIEMRRSNWILSFNGRTLKNPDKAGWKVKRDGGIFDQFTGATITPRAVVKAVYKSLQFYQQYRDEVFAENKK
ncbi:electron transport complex protein RnfG [Candidatus Thiomargarita nelsonii]|uniref:Ion-translocating oxidoreductase complex subunit G n=1 Tax=Candidatus Thiomargarita nelsonii TaxID=1003181 RepID=A0A176S170_9GAMM|nr:electron transport complex protein RnfG [Candidatus Thiomargarita nelsonii]